MLLTLNLTKVGEDADKLYTCPNSNKCKIEIEKYLNK
jgi:hypothetical protein